MTRPDPVAHHDVCGIILAGGLSRRMGGGIKCLKPLGGRPLLARIVERVRPQVGALLLNINGDRAPFDVFHLPIATDVVAGHAGPLAGILTGFEWASGHVPGAAWLASFASDAPFLPFDLVTRLRGAAEDAGAAIACARSGGRAHPVFALWSVDLRGELHRAVVDEDMRKMDAWTARFPIVHVDFPDKPIDPFFNINHPEDLAEAEALLAEDFERG